MSFILYSFIYILIILLHKNCTLSADKADSLTNTFSSNSFPSNPEAPILITVDLRNTKNQSHCILRIFLGIFRNSNKKSEDTEKFLKDLEKLN